HEHRDQPDHPGQHQHLGTSLNGLLRAYPGARMSSRAVIAAGHPVTAEAGARVLRAGGNAVDAAVAAVLASAVAEPLLTGLGAGGYLLVAGAGQRPMVPDFFVAAPGRRPHRPSPH